MKTIFSKICKILQVVCFLSLLSCTNTTPENKSVKPEIKPSASIPFTWTIDRKNLIGDTILTIGFDPLAKREKQYKAYPLKENLTQILPKGEFSDSLQLIFHCTDGYSPAIPLSTLETERAFLAYADLESTKAGKNWPDSLADKYHPFYVVWTNQTSEHTLPWAYGVYQLKFDYFQDEYKLAFPKDKSYHTGFKLFQEKCIKCHSINKTGGQVGPEFNVPKNITEYWTKEDIWAFVNNPQSYRYNSKMPKIEHLDSNDFNKIYNYLQHMKMHKIAFE